MKTEEEVDDQEKNLVSMKNSGFKRNNPQTVPSPKKEKNYPKGKSEEAQFNCTECLYQATSNEELTKHINLKHKTFKENKITCKNCGEQFGTKWNLMYHRKSKHLNTVAFCRNKQEGHCPFADDMCWWNHVKKLDDNIECYICNETFKTKVDLMKHRKTNHIAMVTSCSRF